jgi:competence protein ComEA
VAQLSRSQLLVYGAIAVAVLLLGARWLGSGDDGGGDAFGAVNATPTGGAGGAGGVEIAQSAGGLVVHVAGEVQKPGVYRLAAGSRVTDAVQRAGGVTAHGAPDAINLAAKLADGQQIIVPAAIPTAGGGVATAGAATSATEATDGPISLGSATAEQLDTIDGIGPVTAADIITFRDEHGGLSSVDELDQLSGIGPATMEALRDRLQP